MNQTTKRHPRTMQQAFGPYTSHDLEPMPDDHLPWMLRDLAAAIIYILALIAIGIILAWRG